MLWECVSMYVVYNNQPWGTHNNQQRTIISDGIVMGRGVGYRYKLIQQYTVLRIGRHLFSRGEYITFAKKGRDCWQSEGAWICLRWVSKHQLPYNLDAYGFRQSDEHIAMGYICLECCTCENLRDTTAGTVWFWKKVCGVHTRNREQNKYEWWVGW